MAFKALDVAKYVVDYCTQQNKPISNLKLQKMLYFLWIDYYKLTGEYLFDDEICAWQLGPVVPDVYYEYCSYAGSPIEKQYEVKSLIGTVAVFNIRDIINRYIDKTAAELVKISHTVGNPWDLVYRNGAGNREIIPFELIIQLECCK